MDPKRDIRTWVWFDQLGNSVEKRCCAGLNGRTPMSHQNGSRDLSQSITAGQLALLGAAIIVMLFYAFTYVR